MTCAPALAASWARSSCFWIIDSLSPVQDAWTRAPRTIRGIVHSLRSLGAERTTTRRNDALPALRGLAGEIDVGYCQIDMPRLVGGVRGGWDTRSTPVHAQPDPEGPTIRPNRGPSPCLRVPGCISDQRDPTRLARCQPTHGWHASG